MTDYKPPVTNLSRASALVDLLEKQAGYYRQLKALSQQQGQLVAAGEAESLLSLLSQRQALIDQLSIVDSDLAEFRQSWDQIIATLDEAGRVRIKTLVNEVQQLLSHIVEQDDRDQKKLIEVKTTVSSTMSHITKTNAAARAYSAQPGGVNNRFTNQQG